MSEKLIRTRLSYCRRDAFTLVELLVVVSVIALLIAMLLPSLQSAREQAKAVKCAANTHHVGTAMASYVNQGGGSFPPSYVYPTDEKGSWGIQDGQQNNNSSEFGYLHWSWFLYNGGDAPKEAFQCPNYPSGGAPRTNPGRLVEDWELGQQIDAGNDTTPNELEDKQAPRIAYTANAAVVPRNKFTNGLSGGPRVNVLVTDNRIRRAGEVALATEFLRNWKALGVQQGSHVLVKSHRPINPFYHVGFGYNEYAVPERTPGFTYGDPNQNFGVLEYNAVKDATNLLDHTSGVAQINAVARHHPGGDERFGGTANFLFCDAHTERMTPIQSMKGRKWGDFYYSLSGKNEILRWD
jgi:prepilin-type N-terminal cleavage/methylation domain-containing protein/prepilin-type processing-associated H-X9-DG protein